MKTQAWPRPEAEQDEWNTTEAPESPLNLDPVSRRPLLNASITVIRFVPGVLATALLVVAGWPLELIIGLLFLVVTALIETRPAILRFFEKWPFVVCIPLRRVWKWTFND